MIPEDDTLSGKEEYGDSKRNEDPWGIKFDHLDKD